MKIRYIDSAVCCRNGTKDGGCYGVNASLLPHPYFSIKAFYSNAGYN